MDEWLVTYDMLLCINNKLLTPEDVDCLSTSRLRRLTCIRTDRPIRCAIPCHVDGCAHCRLRMLDDGSFRGTANSHLDVNSHGVSVHRDTGIAEISIALLKL